MENILWKNILYLLQPILKAATRSLLLTLWAEDTFILQTNFSQSKIATHITAYHKISKTEEIVVKIYQIIWTVTWIVASAKSYIVIAQLKLDGI